MLNLLINEAKVDPDWKFIYKAKDTPVLHYIITKSLLELRVYLYNAGPRIDVVDAMKRGAMHCVAKRLWGPTNLDWENFKA